MSDPETCGQGLAESSALPAKLAELTEAVAQVLEVHMRALDLEDNDSRREHEAYRELTRDHRKIAVELGQAARRMAGYRDLPMGRHDPAAMSSPSAVEALERLVAVENELWSMLRERMEADRRRLSDMRGRS